MDMEIYLDLENTLLNSKKTLSIDGMNFLRKLSKEHKVVVLTSGILDEAKDLFYIPDISIVSTIENKMFKNHIYQYTPLKCDRIPKLLSLPFVYTLYAIDQDTTYILKYQERMKDFYPNSKIKICSQFPSTIASFVIAVYKDGLNEIQELLKDFHIESIAEDSKKALLLVTNYASTKEGWLLKLKESPAIAIGDSFTDYDFIKHCEIQVAMKNGEEALKEVCPFQTTKTNQENGALDFVLTYLKHQQA